jgi:hypothetical protein
MALFDRAKKILLQPKQEWEVISGESTSMADLYTGYAMPLAAIGPVCSVIGLSVVGISLPIVGTYRVPIMSSILSAIVQYALALAAVYILAIVIDNITPKFEGLRDMGQALKLATYSSTASWVAGIFILIPVLAILGLVGLYSIYLLYAGTPILMKVPREKAAIFTAVVIVAAIVIFTVMNMITRAFIPYPTPV